MDAVNRYLLRESLLLVVVIILALATLMLSFEIFLWVGIYLCNYIV